MNHPAPFVVALSGGIASGKSMATDEFGRLGATVLDADVAAREVVAEGQPGLTEIVAAFGSDVLDTQGRLDRAAMRRRIFADPVARQMLEAIVHPRVNVWLRSKANGSIGSAYCVLAIPLLAETWPAYVWVDRVAVVDVDKNLQLDRLLQRDGISRDLALDMINAQASREQRNALANDLIHNSGTAAEFYAQVRVLDRKYRKLAQLRACHAP